MRDSREKRLTPLTVLEHLTKKGWQFQGLLLLSYLFVSFEPEILFFSVFLIFFSRHPPGLLPVLGPLGSGVVSIELSPLGSIDTNNLMSITYFDQQTACRATVRWSKYTQTLVKIYDTYHFAATNLQQNRVFRSYPGCKRCSKKKSALKKTLWSYTLKFSFFQTSVKNSTWYCCSKITRKTVFFQDQIPPLIAAS